MALITFIVCAIALLHALPEHKTLICLVAIPSIFFAEKFIQHSEIMWKRHKEPHLKRAKGHWAYAKTSRGDYENIKSCLRALKQGGLNIKDLKLSVNNFEKQLRTYWTFYKPVQCANEAEFQKKFASFCHTHKTELGLQ